MNRYHFFSLIFLIFAVVFFLIGFLEGDIEGGIFFIFPFVIGSGIFLLIGILMIFLALIFYMFGFIRFHFPEKDYPISHEKPDEKKTTFKGGGVVLIGPIPIVFGSSWKIAIIMMVLAILIIFIIFLLMRANLF